MVRWQKTRARDAFTLIEVMVAMTVLALALASSMIAITLGFRILEDARMSTLASQVLQSEMETLRLKTWEEVPGSGSFEIDSTLDAASFRRFNCTRTITAIDAEMKAIELAVSWTSTSGRPKDLRYLTYMAKGGLNDYFYRKL